MKRMITLLATLMLGIASIFAQDIKEIEIKTSAECDECKVAIEEAVNDLTGIDTCSLDIPTRILTVRYDAEDLELETIKKAINMAGYDADDTKATKRGLANLPDCCKPGGMGK